MRLRRADVGSSHGGDDNDGGTVREKSVQVALLHSDDLKYLGVKDQPMTSTGQYRLCNSTSAAARGGGGGGGDSQPRLHVDPELHGRYLLQDIVLPNDGTEAEYSTEWSITRSGIYYALIVNCRPSGSSSSSSSSVLDDTGNSNGRDLSNDAIVEGQVRMKPMCTFLWKGGADGIC